MAARVEGDPPTRTESGEEHDRNGRAKTRGRDDEEGDENEGLRADEENAVCDREGDEGGEWETSVEETKEKGPYFEGGEKKETR